MVELTGLQLEAELVLLNDSVLNNTAESQRTKKRKVSSSVMDDWLHGAMASQEQQVIHTFMIASLVLMRFPDSMTSGTIQNFIDRLVPLLSSDKAIIHGYVYAILATTVRNDLYQPRPSLVENAINQLSNQLSGPAVALFLEIIMKKSSGIRANLEIFLHFFA
jgi:hypothetical protein